MEERGFVEQPLRVMSLHALTYCERLFYLEEVEEIRVADERVYAGRTLHLELEADEAERVSLELSSEALGLTGKMDAVRRRDGRWYPYEHKRGRAFRRQDGSAAAWKTDEIQVAAYGLLLQEHLGAEVEEGRIRYHEDGVTVRVALSEEVRDAVRATIARARVLRSAVERPPVCREAGHCVRCSLAPVCLPEEERLAENKHWETVRLFPPRQEGQALHVVSHGTRVGRSADRLVIQGGAGGEAEEVPVQELSSVSIHGNGQLTTQAIHLLAQNQIPVHWLSGGGRYLCGMAAASGGVQRRIRQYRALTDEATVIRLVRRLATARVDSQLRYTLRATRDDGAKRAAVRAEIEAMRGALRRMATAADADAIRGHEGAAGAAWYQALPQFLAQNAGEAMRPSGRSRRPPRDRFNALLSYGYALLYATVHAGILAVGLEPAFGFFHTPRSAAHPLVLDLMELFRVPVWDVALIGSVNRRQWDPEEDFVDAGSRLA